MSYNIILIFLILALILLISIFIFILKINASTKNKIDEDKIQKTITNEIKDTLMNNQILNKTISNVKTRGVWGRSSTSIYIRKHSCS